MLERLIVWIDTLKVHSTIRETEWIVPSVQVIHILAVSMLFGSSLVLALRSYGLVGGDWAPAQWTRRLNGWIVASLVFLLLSGIVMITGEPERTITNFAFQLKMTMLLVAILAVWVLVRRMKPIVNDQPMDAVAKAAGAVLILLWLAIIAAGRWIAYS